jgi:hypothetical protein
LTTPKVLTSARLREHFGFVPQYPVFSTGLKEALDAL